MGGVFEKVYSVHSNGRILAGSWISQPVGKSEHCALYSVHCVNTVLFLALLFIFTPGEKHLTSPTFSVIHFLNIRTPPLHCAACACSACGIHCAACGVWGVTRVWLLETQPCLSPLLMALPVEEILILLAFSSTFVLVWLRSDRRDSWPRSWAIVDQFLPRSHRSIGLAGIW